MALLRGKRQDQHDGDKHDRRYQWMQPSRLRRLQIEDA
jgi:hypothetical protein